jgi:hypothetical protein
MGLTKMQTTAACLIVAALPVVYQWKPQRDLSQQGATLRAQLAESQQLLALAQRERDDASQRAQQLQGAIAQLKTRPGLMATARSQPRADPLLWSETSAYVQVPKALLEHIHIPALGDDGLLGEDMVRALGLEAKPVEQINAALKTFSTEYRALETAHFHPSETHPSSIHISPVQGQKTFICDAFPQEYLQLLGPLRASLEQTMSSSNTEYFWSSMKDEHYSKYDPDYGPVSKRITIFRPGREQPGGGPYYIGEEQQLENGSWGNARMGPVDDESQVQSPVLKAVIAEWKKQTSKP